MGVTVGPVPRERAAEYLEVMGGVFGSDVEEDDLARFDHVFEWDRARGAYDGERLVGTVGTFSLDMTVPGTTMRCGGTTVVTVLPTHRRRGILRMMLDSHLDDVRERGEPIAALWATDSGIYGRFGYGMAARDASVEVLRDYSGFHRLAPPLAPVRLIDREEAGKVIPAFYDSVRRHHPGFFARSANWWQYRRLRDRPSDRNGATAYRFAVTEENGAVTGYAQYRFKPEWKDGHGAGELRVSELLGSSPESWAGLWRFLLDHDLTRTITAGRRSPDDPLFGLLAASRRARTSVDDSLWVRIMDVRAALEGRSYSAPAEAVVRIHDPLDASHSTWNLSLSPEGAEVTPTDSEPGVEIDLEDLGASFLGWARFRELAAAGRVRGDAASLGALDRAFTWHPGPWGCEVF